MHRFRLTALIALPCAAVVALSACSAPETAQAPSALSTAASAAAGDASSLLAAHGLDGKSGREVVEAWTNSTPNARCRWPRPFATTRCC